jgi:UDP-N-acetylglucosamine--N-acetylmuramyl-(pentapeptide) pyrophosphoryl-undecaprenol N-acetylglucosamine transferase
VVVGFGGYPAIPAMAAAWLTRRPRAIHEQNGVLGRVNRLFARRVDAVACGTWPTDPALRRLWRPHRQPGARRDPGARGRALHDARRLADEPSGLRRQPGRAGAVRRGARGGRAVAARICGPTCAWRSRRGPKTSTASRGLCRDGRRAEVAPFFDDMPRRLTEAQLVIARSGASSVADICVVGRPAIYDPLCRRRARRADRQRPRARRCRGRRPDARKQADARGPRRAIAAILTQPDAAIRMAEAALSVSVPDATERLVALVEGLANPDPKDAT